MVKVPKWYTSVSGWPNMIEEIVDGEIGQEDVKLITYLARSIMNRWRDLSAPTMNPTEEFERLYKDNERNAKAAILAILELVQTVGDGRPILEQYEKLLKNV